MPAPVHNGGNDHHVTFHSVDDSVGEAAGAAFPVVFGDFSPSFRVAKNATDGPFDFVEKFQSQTWNSAVVVIGGIRQFALGWRKETVGHWARRLRKS